MNLNALASMISGHQLQTKTQSIQSVNSVGALSTGEEQSKKTTQNETSLNASYTKLSIQAKGLSSIDEAMPSLEKIQSLLQEVQSSLNSFFDSHGFDTQGNFAMSFSLDASFSNMNVNGGNGHDGQKIADLFSNDNFFESQFKQLAMMSESVERQSDGPKGAHPVFSQLADSIRAAEQGPKLENTFSFDYQFSELSIQMNGKPWLTNQTPTTQQDSANSDKPNSAPIDKQSSEVEVA